MPKQKETDSGSTVLSALKNFGSSRIADAIPCQLTKVLTVDFEYSPSATLGGTYSFPETNNHRLLDDWLTHYSEFNGTNEMTSTNLKSGTLTLEDLGSSRYMITVHLTMMDGTIFQGTYKGPVTAVFNNG